MRDDGLVLRGYATTFGEVIESSLGSQMFAMTAFNNWVSSPNRRSIFCLNHSKSDEWGSTDDYLSLFLDKRGLAFEYRFPDTHDAKHYRLCAETRNGASIGFQYRRTHDEVIDGKTITVVDQVDLEDISLVDIPVNRSAFAMLCRPDQTLSEVCQSGQLFSDGKYLAFKNAAKQIALKLQTL